MQTQNQTVSPNQVYVVNDIKTNKPFVFESNTHRPNKGLSSIGIKSVVENICIYNQNNITTEELSSIGKVEYLQHYTNRNDERLKLFNMTKGDYVIFNKSMTGNGGTHTLINEVINNQEIAIITMPLNVIKQKETESDNIISVYVSDDKVKLSDEYLNNPLYNNLVDINKLAETNNNAHIIRMLNLLVKVAQQPNKRIVIASTVESFSMCLQYVKVLSWIVKDYKQFVDDVGMKYETLSDAIKHQSKHKLLTQLVNVLTIDGFKFFNSTINSNMPNVITYIDEAHIHTLNASYRSDAVRDMFRTLIINSQNLTNERIIQSYSITTEELEAPAYIDGIALFSACEFTENLIEWTHTRKELTELYNYYIGDFNADSVYVDLFNTYKFDYHFVSYATVNQVGVIELMTGLNFDVMTIKELNINVDSHKDLSGLTTTDQAHSTQFMSFHGIKTTPYKTSNVKDSETGKVKRVRDWTATNSIFASVEEMINPFNNGHLVYKGTKNDVKRNNLCKDSLVRLQDTKTDLATATVINAIYNMHNTENRKPRIEVLYDTTPRIVGVLNNLFHSGLLKSALDYAILTTKVTFNKKVSTSTLIGNLVGGLIDMNNTTTRNIVMSAYSDKTEQELKGYTVPELYSVLTKDDLTTVKICNTNTFILTMLFIKLFSEKYFHEYVTRTFVNSTFSNEYANNVYYIPNSYLECFEDVLTAFKNYVFDVVNYINGGVSLNDLTAFIPYANELHKHIVELKLINNSNKEEVVTAQDINEELNCVDDEEETTDDADVIIGDAEFSHLGKLDFFADEVLLNDKDNVFLPNRKVTFYTNGIAEGVSTYIDTNSNITDVIFIPLNVMTSGKEFISYDEKVLQFQGRIRNLNELPIKPKLTTVALSIYDNNATTEILTSGYAQNLTINKSTMISLFKICSTVDSVKSKFSVHDQIAELFGKVKHIGFIFNGDENDCSSFKVSELVKHIQSLNNYNQEQLDVIRNDISLLKQIYKDISSHCRNNSRLVSTIKDGVKCSFGELSAEFNPSREELIELIAKCKEFDEVVHDFSKRIINDTDNKFNLWDVLINDGHVVKGLFEFVKGMITVNRILEIGKEGLISAIKNELSNMNIPNPEQLLNIDSDDILSVVNGLVMPNVSINGQYLATMYKHNKLIQGILRDELIKRGVVDADAIQSVGQILSNQLNSTSLNEYKSNHTASKAEFVECEEELQTLNLTSILKNSKGVCTEGVHLIKECMNTSIFSGNSLDNKMFIYREDDYSIKMIKAFFIENEKEFRDINSTLENYVYSNYIDYKNDILMQHAYTVKVKAPVFVREYMSNPLFLTYSILDRMGVSAMSKIINRVMEELLQHNVIKQSKHSNPLYRATMCVTENQLKKIRAYHKSNGIPFRKDNYIVGIGNSKVKLFKVKDIERIVREMFVDEFKCDKVYQYEYEINLIAKHIEQTISGAVKGKFTTIEEYIKRGYKIDVYNLVHEVFFDITRCGRMTYNLIGILLELLIRFQYVTIHDNFSKCKFDIDNCNTQERTNIRKHALGLIKTRELLMKQTFISFGYTKKEVEGLFTIKDYTKVVDIVLKNKPN